MTYQKSTKILLEAGEPTDPSRRRFLKTAGAAAVGAAMPGELKTLAKITTQPIKKMPETSMIDKLFQAAVKQEADPTLKNFAAQQVLSSKNFEVPEDEIPWLSLQDDEDYDEDVEDYKKPQGITGMLPRGSSYVIHKTPKGRMFLETDTRVDFSGQHSSLALVFIKNGVPQRLEIYHQHGLGDNFEIVSVDKTQKKIAENWFGENDTGRWSYVYSETPQDMDDEPIYNLSELVDVLIGHTDPQDQQLSKEKNTNSSNQPVIRATDTVNPVKAASSINPVKAASNINPIKAASNLAGLDQIKNLVKKLLRTDQPQSQPQAPAEKPAVPALPAPDKTQSEIMAQLRDIVDRDLSQPEKELVKREVEKETNKLKKPPDESWG